MTSPSNIICILATIFGTLQAAPDTEENQWQTHRLISRFGWSEKAEDFDNPTFVYALCENEPLVDSKRECMIIYREDIHSNDANPKQCTFTLGNASNGIIRMEIFGSDKVIFVWSDETKGNKTLQSTFNTAVIKMSNCQIDNTDLVVHSPKTWAYGDVIWHMFHVEILTYEDTFDVIFQGVQACGDATDDSHCASTYNNDGKRIAGPRTIFSPHCDDDHYVFRQGSRSSSDDGYMVNVGSKPHARVFLLKPTEKSSEKVVTKLLWKSPMKKEGSFRFTYGWNKEMIVVCTCETTPLNKLTCSCSQSDQEGNSKRRLEFAVDQPSNTVSLVSFMHNLREGGFIFVPFYSDDASHYYFMHKVNVDGRVTGKSVIIESHPRTCSPQFKNTRLVERDDGKYCITIACLEDKMSLKTVTKCYNLSSLE